MKQLCNVSFIISPIQIFTLLNLFLIIIHNVNSTITAQLVTTIHGELEAGNYSHYSLHENGNFKLVLQSLQGDADLYVSDKQRRVDFSNYDWQSITYGIDEVYITDSMTRPVAISVYAHPYYPKSVYTMRTYSIYSNDKNYETHSLESNEKFKEFYHKNMLKDGSSRDSLKDHSAHSTKERYETNFHDQDTENENESMLWTILIHLLKLIAEIVL